MYINGPEQRQCPAEFQERITSMFGVNQFGDPHFKIVWGQSVFIRMGYQKPDGSTGYRDRYQAHAMPCWVIMRWKAPEQYGSPDGYYMNSWMSTGKRRAVHQNADGSWQVEEFDEPGGFYVTGEYPWRGRYEIVQPLQSKEFIGNRLVVEHFPLSHLLIDLVIPLILAYQELSLEERAAARRLVREEEERRETAQLAEEMLERMPTWMNPVSYARQGCRTALIDKKMEQIQKAWDRLSKAGRAPVFNRGLALGDRPRVATYR